MTRQYYRNTCIFRQPTEPGILSKSEPHHSYYKTKVPCFEISMQGGDLTNRNNAKVQIEAEACSDSSEEEISVLELIRRENDRYSFKISKVKAKGKPTMIGVCAILSFWRSFLLGCHGFQPPRSSELIWQLSARLPERSGGSL